MYVYIYIRQIFYLKNWNMSFVQKFAFNGFWKYANLWGFNYSTTR